MRSLFIFCLVVLAGGPFVVAQQRDEPQRFEPDPVSDPFRSERGTDRPNPTLPARDIASDELPVPTADTATASIDKWKPQYRVVLKLTKNGQSIVSTETYSVPRTIIAHREVTREGFNGPFRQTVAEENTVIEQMQRQVVSPGIAVLVCDSISVAMKAADDGEGKGFAFETTGRTRLLLGNYTLDCDALAFADGVLSLKSTQSAKDVFKMQASEMKFELNVFGVASSRFDQSVEGLAPEPSAIANPSFGPYEPERREFDRDERSRPPTDRGADFRRRPVDDSAAEDFSRRGNGAEDRSWDPAPVPDPRLPLDDRSDGFGR